METAANPLSAAKRSDAGPPPWQARLDLRYALAPDGSTRLVHNQHLGPLRVQRALYPEGKALAHTLLLHPPGGLAGGDSLAMQLTLAPGAQVLCTTPGASKWYHGERGGAQQTVQLTLAAGASLEWLPQEAILFDGADALQALQMELHPSASLIGWDMVQFGRIAAGEAWQRGRWRQRMVLRRDGRECWREFADLGADDPLRDSAIGMAGHAVSATLWASAPSLRAQPDKLLAELRDCAAGYDVRCGIGWVGWPQELLLVRALGSSAEVVRALLEAVWQRMRPSLVGRMPQRPRIWDT